MSRPLAVLLLALVVAACGGEDDETPCSRGSLMAGDSVTGVLDGSRCSEFLGIDTTWQERWTLQAESQSAYVVRAYRIADADVAGPWDGSVDLYTGVIPRLVTVPWGSYGPDQDRAELIFTTDTAATVMLQVSIHDRVDAAKYALEVERCPVHPIVPADTLTGIDLAAGCTSRAYRAGGPYRVGFVTFPAEPAGDSAALIMMQVSRTGGNGTVYAVVAGRGMDLGCFEVPECVKHLYPGFTGSLGAVLPTPFPGRYTLLLGVHVDSTATTDVAMTPYDPAPPP